MKQTLKYIYSIVFENLKFAEAKHSVVITLSGAVIAFASTFFSGNLRQNIFAIASIIFGLTAIFYSFVALVARKVRIREKKIRKNKNLIFYKDIMKFDEMGYIQEIKAQYDFTKLYKPDEMDYDLARQIIAVAKLTYIKFLYFNFAIVFLVASIVCIIVTVLIRGQIW